MLVPTVVSSGARSNLWPFLKTWGFLSSTSSHEALVLECVLSTDGDGILDAELVFEMMTELCDTLFWELLAEPTEGLIMEIVVGLAGELRGKLTGKLTGKLIEELIVVTDEELFDQPLKELFVEVGREVVEEPKEELMRELFDEAVVELIGELCVKLVRVPIGELAGELIDELIVETICELMATLLLVTRCDSTEVLLCASKKTAGPLGLDAAAFLRL